jgi:hypothetical protein
MNHPHATAMIAPQHRSDLQRRAEQARLVKQAGNPHGVRVLRTTTEAPATRGIWTRVVAVVGRTAVATPSPEPKLA